MTRQLIDYLEALRLRDATAEITLGGRVFTVQRARLGLSYRLTALSATLTLPAGAAAYVALASGLDPADLGATALEIAEAFCLLHDFNTFRGTLPVQWPSGRPQQEVPEDYPNRALSSTVALLARAYGWTADHILEGLGPEEAVCYIQEAVVAEHADRAFAWEIADLRDKAGRHIKYPALPWGKLQRRAKPAGEIPAHLRPGGVVVTLAELAKGKGMPNV